MKYSKQELIIMIESYEEDLINIISLATRNMIIKKIKKLKSQLSELNKELDNIHPQETN